MQRVWERLFSSIFSAISEGYYTMIYDYQVPFKRRVVQVLCAIVWCLFSGGPIFGFAALKPILIKQHIYESLCDLEPVMFAVTSESNLAKCTSQDLKLNMMFTVGAVMTNVSALVIGLTLDKYGPRVCGLIGSFFLFVACFIFINATKISLFDPYLFGYASMALGGPFAYISSFQLSNAFPAKSGTVLLLLTGAFDASSALFFIYKVVFNHYDESIPIASFFKLYLLVPVFITTVQIFIMPAESYGIAPTTTTSQSEEAIINENTALLSADEQQQISPAHRRDSIGEALKASYAEEVEQEETQHVKGSIFGVLHGFDTSYQFKSYWFGLMALFTTIQMLRLNYFVATINTQYTYLIGTEKLEALNKLFDIALPLGGIVSIPFVGLFLDNCSTFVVLSGLLLFSLVIGILGVIPSMLVGIIHVLIFVAYRPFFYTSISDYCAKVFGFRTFGKIYGTIMCISGIANFAQSYFDKETHTTFKMNPVPINVILVCVTLVIGIITVSYIHHQATNYYEKKKRLDRVVNAVTGGDTVTA